MLLMLKKSKPPKKFSDALARDFAVIKHSIDGRLCCGSLLATRADLTRTAARRFLPPLLDLSYLGAIANEPTSLRPE
jgi:hypothetical protein